jgi:hypothetical protein
MYRNTISINSTTIGTTTAAGIFSGISVLAGTVNIGSTPETPLVPQPEMMLFRFHLPLP